MCYTLARPTADLDVFEVAPSTALEPLVRAAGKGTALAQKHGVYVDAGSRVATLPENYADRLTEIFEGAFVNLRLLVLDPYDLALSKLERNIDRDREDVQLLSHARGFDLGVLRERYLTEFRPVRDGRCPPTRPDARPVGRDDRGDPKHVFMSDDSASAATLSNPTLEQLAVAP